MRVILYAKLETLYIFRLMRGKWKLFVSRYCTEVLNWYSELQKRSDNFFFFLKSQNLLQFYKRRWTLLIPTSGQEKQQLFVVPDPCSLNNRHAVNSILPSRHTTPWEKLARKCGWTLPLTSKGIREIKKSHVFNYSRYRVPSGGSN